MSKLTITCTEFRPWRRNTLAGFAVVNIVELKLTIKDVAIHQKEGSRWAQLPAKPQIKDGAIVKDDAGKAQYISIMEFSSREVRDAFSAAVVAAVLEHTPGAFDADAAVQTEHKPATSKRGDMDDAIPFALATITAIPLLAMLIGSSAFVV